MNRSHVNKILKQLTNEMFDMEFKSVYGLLKWTDLNIWNLLHLYKNKQLNDDKRLMNYYIQIIKQFMESPLYFDTFKSHYNEETEKQLLDKLLKEDFNSFVFVLTKIKIVKHLVKNSKYENKG